MRFEDIRVSLEPRTTLQALDLAVWFAGRSIKTCLLIWAVAAFIATAAVALVASCSSFGMLAAYLMFLLASGWQGTLLTIGAIRACFGEEFSWATIWRTPATTWRLLLMINGLRIVTALLLPLLIIPGFYFLVSFGFEVENRLLAELHAERHDRRAAELVKLEYSGLVNRLTLLWFFGGCLWILLSITADMTLTFLFGSPVFLGRVGQIGGLHGTFDQYFEAFFQLLFNDPAVLGLGVSAALFVHLLCRLAWFFCYTDLRVRRDCWDVELRLLQETQQLQQSTR